MRSLCLAIALALPSAAMADCRQALSIGMDISGSVDEVEYRLQMHGLAGALSDPAVRDAFLAMPGNPVRLHVFEWGGIGTQREVVGWREITDAQTLQDIADLLTSKAREPREVPTALGRAMEFGANELSTQSDCWRQTLDLTGDGQSNQGPRPRTVRADLFFSGVTINALVIGADDPSPGDRRHSDIAELSSYFRAEVILGPDAFVEVALGFEEFQDAMTRKLLKELQTLAVSDLKDQ